MTPERIVENINVADFELSLGDKETIDALNLNERDGARENLLSLYSTNKKMPRRKLSLRGIFIVQYSVVHQLMGE